MTSADLADRTVTAGPVATLAAGPAAVAAVTAGTAAPTVSERAVPLVIRTQGLTKRFGSGQVAVDGVDLEVSRGSVYGFIGPNGSGKTTTIRMLLGLVRPSSGRVWLLGRPMPEAALQVLPWVGALVEGPAFQPYLSGPANLARLDACDATADPRTARHRIGEVLERVGLTGVGRKPYRQYSLGMKQRLGLAAALLRPRDLLVLDEPTNGLDPQGTREVRNLIRQLAAAGTTVLVSSHLLTEIEQVCTHVGVMSRGRLVLQGERAALTAGAHVRLAVTTSVHHVAAAASVLRAEGLRSITTDGVHLTGVLGEAAPEQVTAALVAAGVDVVGLAVERPSLEQLFVTLTGEGFDVVR